MKIFLNSPPDYATHPPRFGLLHTPGGSVAYWQRDLWAGPPRTRCQPRAGPQSALWETPDSTFPYSPWTWKNKNGCKRMHTKKNSWIKWTCNNILQDFSALGFSSFNFRHNCTCMDQVTRCNAWRDAPAMAAETGQKTWSSCLHQLDFWTHVISTIIIYM